MTRERVEAPPVTSVWLWCLVILRSVVRRLPLRVRNWFAFRLRLPMGRRTMVVHTKEGFRFEVWDLFEIVQRYVFWTGTWEPEEGELLMRTAPAGGTVVDVGAQLGYFTLTACAAVGPSGRVVAVEPMTVNRERLQRNLELNNFTNVTVLDEAAASETGTAKFASRADRHQTSWGGFAAEGDVTVHTRPLDDMLATAGIDGDVHFLKIDVEGGEPDVIAGAQGLLASPRLKGPVLIEINELRLGERGHSGDGVIASLEACGFRDATTELGLDPTTGDRNLAFVRGGTAG